MAIPTVLVTGSAGQLGSALQATFKAHSAFTPLFCSKAMLDITVPDQIEAYLKAHPIQYIINCAAYTNVQLAEKETEKCYSVNSIGPGHLATLAKKYHSILFHISTDYVFGATIGHPLQPNDATDPLNQYGQSKRAGEALIAKCTDHFYIIRTAWLYGEKGSNFFTKMVTLAQKGDPIQMVDDQIGSPTYLYDLATAIWEIIEKMINHKNYPFGIYHYTNEGVASWYDFAHAILAGLPNRCVLTPRPSTALELKRPYYSVLSKTSFREVFQIKIPHWQDSLAVCLKRSQLVLPH